MRRDIIEQTIKDWNKYKIDLAFLKNRESLEELRERLENEED